MKTLLSIEPYYFTGEEIGKIKSLNKDREYWKRHLPKYCFNENFDNIQPTEYYHQFTYNGDNKYLLFDIETSDRLLYEEISQCGFVDLFENEEVKILKNIILDKFKIMNYDDSIYKIFPAQYVIVSLNYSEPDRDGECDMSITIDDKLKF